MEENSLQQILADTVAASRSHHVTVSYFFVSIIVGLLLMMGAGAYFGLRSYERLLDKAEAQEERYNADRKAFYDTLAQHDADRAENDAKQAQLIAGIAARAKNAPAPVVQAGIKPNATALEVKNALEAVLSPRHPDMGPVEVIGENLALRPAQAQKLVLDEVVLTRTLADLDDTQKVLELEKGTSGSLKEDLTTCKSTLSSANDTVEAYKKAAKKSKWRKFLDGAQKGALIVAGIAIGKTL